MFGFLKNMSIVLWTSLLNSSSHIKCVSLTNQKCEIQPTLINLHSDEYSQEIHYDPFAFKLDRCVGSFNTLNDLSNKVCVPNKAEDLSIYVLNTFTGINKSKILAKHVSCKCKCKFDGKKSVTQIKRERKINIDASVKIIKKTSCVKKRLYLEPC